jgi:hypothetical protein
MLLLRLAAERVPDNPAEKPGDHRVAGHHSGGAIASHQEAQTHSHDNAHDGEQNAVLHLRSLAQIFLEGDRARIF